MDAYDPRVHHRRSIRLPSYDYAQPGAYFLTICLEDRRCLFGRIALDEMALNDAGRMIGRWWLELPRKFRHVSLDAHVVMPNHFHGILVIADAGGLEGEDLGAHAGAPLPGGEASVLSAHAGAPLPRVVQWFKTMTTNEYIRGVKDSAWSRFDGTLWQRGYYERVVRDEAELEKFREYVFSNPLRWADDHENPCRADGIGLV